MSGFCNLRKNNPLKVFSDYFDAVWHFTLAIKGQDFVNLEPSEMPAKSAYRYDSNQRQTVVVVTKGYNLRPRKAVCYKV